MYPFDFRMASVRGYPFDMITESPTAINIRTIPFLVWHHQQVKFAKNRGASVFFSDQQSALSQGAYELLRCMIFGIANQINLGFEPFAHLFRAIIIRSLCDTANQSVIEMDDVATLDGRRSCCECPDRYVMRQASP